MTLEEFNEKMEKILELYEEVYKSQSDYPSCIAISNFLGKRARMMYSRGIKTIVPKEHRIEFWLYQSSWNSLNPYRKEYLAEVRFLLLDTFRLYCLESKCYKRW